MLTNQSQITICQTPDSPMIGYSELKRMGTWGSSYSVQLVSVGSSSGGGASCLLRVNKAKINET